MANREFQEHYTAKDYALWQGDWELIYGAPYAMSPSPTLTHQRINSALHLALHHAFKNCVQCEVLYEIDVHLDEDTVVRPDVLVVCNQEGDFIRKAPELIVEIVSPSSVRRDEHLKFELYETEGVQIYIIVYPEEQKAKVFQLKEGRYIKQGDYLQNTFNSSMQGCAFELNFATIWPNKTL